MDILVAEDDPITRKLLANMLRKLGHAVQTAPDGLAAWEMIQSHEIRMVITDWMMPGLDGLELCRNIRSLDTAGYVFIILLTAMDAQENIIEGLEAGADDYLCKPFNKGELIARLKSNLRILALETSLREANERITQLSITDDLTGCFNKRYLEQHLPLEIERAKRLGHPLSIVMADIDHFKNVNDTYGHQSGDRVLKTFSECLDSAVRKNVDWLARYGGEEFLIVLPGLEESGGLEAGNRLRAAVEQGHFDINNGHIHLTASFGVAGLKRDAFDEDKSAEALIQKADERLYRAKASGRNRVCSGDRQSPGTE